MLMRVTAHPVAGIAPGACVLGILLSLAVAARATAPAERERPASRVAMGTATSESWDLTAALEGDHWLFARFMITNDGPGKRTGVAIAHLISRDGSVARLRNGRLEGKWNLSPDGLMLDVGSSQLDMHQRRRLDLDSNKQGMKVHLQFGSGALTPALEQTTAPTFGLDLIQAGTPIEGTVWTQGMTEPKAVRGQVALTHMWTGDSAAATVHRQIELVAFHGSGALYLMALTMPDGRSRQWLYVSREGEPLYQTSDFECTLGTPFGTTAASTYPVPETIRIRNAAVSLDVRADAELLRVDPMEVIPNPFRFLLSLTSRPQRLWLRSTFRLTLNAEAGRPRLDTHGAGVVAASFTNPFDQH